MQQSLAVGVHVGNRPYFPDLCARRCADWAQCGCNIYSILSIWQTDLANMSSQTANAVPITTARVLSDVASRDTRRIPSLDTLMGGIRYSNNNGNGNGNSNGKGNSGRVVGAALDF